MDLIKNLLADDFPILFDGLHTTYYLRHPSLQERKKFVRLHNIEHIYYKDLSYFEKNPFKKSYYAIEALKLKSYEGILKKADRIFPISWSDNEHFGPQYLNSEVIPPFHQFNQIICDPGIGTYLLYHGDLSVNENVIAVMFLTDEVFSKVPYKCFIAGKNPPRKLFARVSGHHNITLIPDPDNDRMSELIRNAHISILPSMASNGFRIKLLSSLYAGRHCLVNKQMVYGSGLEMLCKVAGSPDEFIEKVNSLMLQSFTETMKKEREALLIKQFDNISNAEKMAGIIF